MTENPVTDEMTTDSAAQPIRAAGAVLWRDGGNGPEVVLVHRPRYDDWSLPKGKLDPGELAAHAAVREIEEETGYSCVLGRPLLQVGYEVPGDRGRRPKTVGYFTARLRGGGEFAPNDEVDELRWLSVEQAHAVLSHHQDRQVLDAFTESLPEIATVLLVRHAKAGKRSEWAGDDVFRPLNESGERQRDALHSLLPLFAPDEIYSAPRVRCEQTVAPTAEDLGIKITEEPLFSEESYSAEPDAGVRALLRIAARGGTSVVSSQGGVIPDLVTRLAESAGLDLGEVHSRKGSVWALSFRPDTRAEANGSGPAVRLAAADYLADPLP